MTARPWYGGEHKRLRKALIESGAWIGQPCHWCKLPLLPGQRLVLGHATDPDGYSIPGFYLGLTHEKCDVGAGGRVNPFGVRTRAAAARAARSPERVREIEDAEARKTRKQDRAEFARVQKEISGEENQDTAGRDWD